MTSEQSPTPATYRLPKDEPVFGRGAWIIFTYLGLVMIAPPLLRSTYYLNHYSLLLPPLKGLLFSFPVVLAAAFTFLPFRFGVRASISASLIVLATLILYLFDGQYLFEELKNPILLHAMPLIFLAIATPFLLVRYVGGWKILFEYSMQSLECESIENVSIFGIMSYTVAVAFCLALLGTGGGDIWDLELVFVVAAGICGCAILTVLPYVVALLSLDKYLLVWSVVSLVLAPAGAAVIYVANWQTHFISGSLAGLAGFLQPSGLVTIIFFFLFVGAPLIGFRRSSGRLVKGIPHPPTSNESASPKN